MNNSLKYSFSFHQHTNSQEKTISFYLTLWVFLLLRKQNSDWSQKAYASSCRRGVIFWVSCWEQGGEALIPTARSAQSFPPLAGKGAPGTPAVGTAPHTWAWAQGHRFVEGAAMCKCHLRCSKDASEALGVLRCHVLMCGNKINGCSKQRGKR